MSWNKKKLETIIQFKNGKKRPNSSGTIPVYGGMVFLDIPMKAIIKIVSLSDVLEPIVEVFIMSRLNAGFQITPLQVSRKMIQIYLMRIICFQAFNLTEGILERGSRF